MFTTKMIAKKSIQELHLSHERQYLEHFPLNIGVFAAFLAEELLETVVEVSKRRFLM